MEYRLLGHSGIRVSPICLGTAWFGLDPTEEDVPSVVRRALDLGINFFDCANTYGNRASFDRPDRPAHSERRSAEEMLGEALKGIRDRVIVTSKVQEPTGSGPNDGGPNGGGLSRRHIRQQVERSLRRLSTDYIDVYYAHHPDPTTPLEETVRAFDELIHEGKVRYYALSTFLSWQIVHAILIAERYGLNKPICLQMPYNLAERAVEPRIVPVCQTFGLTMTAFSPVGGGLLGGKESRNRTYVGMRRMPQSPRFRDLPKFSEQELAVAEGLEKMAEEWHEAPASIALAWLLKRPALTSAIVGAASQAEVETAVQALDVKLDDQQMAGLDALVSGVEALYSY